MKASIYFNYTSRSLWRGGQRTVLALFCIAVGVMAIVSLQLVGQMLNNAITGNVRDANGGDIAVSSLNTPFKNDDLSFFSSLKDNGTITNYTAVNRVSGSNGVAASIRQSFSVEVVDPVNFPLVTPPVFTAPTNGRLSDLLKDKQIVVDQGFVDQYHKHVGDQMTVHVGAGNLTSVNIPVQIAGIVADKGVFSQANGLVLLSRDDYNTATNQSNATYSNVYVTTIDQKHTDEAKSAIQNQFQTATIQTVADALKQKQDYVDGIKKFLDIAGLLALLIGGVGIINTMQVLLSRRKVEIAMLKTVGYRKLDLYLLFGLEAGLLGLVGGTLGALAAIGVSYLVLQVVQPLFQLSLPFQIDPIIISGGILIGLCTSLIFGLMPIIQSANIRPLNVIRELPGTARAGSIILSVGLVLLLSVLFCVMAAVILNDVMLSIGAVYGTLAYLAFMSLFFVAVVFLVSKLPVPERFNPGYLALVIGATVLSLLLSLVLPAFGILMTIISLMGIVVVLLPRSWKVNIKMALRNIGRQRARTTTTLMALFVGVFTIGLILVLGQNLRDQVNKLVATSLTYNVLTITKGDDSAALRNKLSTIPGLTAAHTQEHSYVSVVPVDVNGTPVKSLLPKGKPSSSFTNLGQYSLVFLSSMEGFDVAHNQVPGDVQITQGRNLNASDAGTNNVLINWTAVNYAPLKGHVNVGGTIDVYSSDGKLKQTLTVVGVYQSSFSSNMGQLYASREAVKSLTPGGQEISVFYMKVDSAKVSNALDVIGKVTPNATVLNLANIGDFIDQYISNTLLVLLVLAMLSLLAGLIIIGNAVALAMLERRRELGILKSVGYTSRSILSEVLIENGVVGGTGALLAMLLVTLVTSLLGKWVFHTSFGVSWYIAIGLIAGIAVLGMMVASLVAWGAVRVRPLEVLRYE